VIQKKNEKVIHYHEGYMTNSGRFKFSCGAVAGKRNVRFSSGEEIVTCPECVKKMNIDKVEE